MDHWINYGYKQKGYIIDKTKEHNIEQNNEFKYVNNKIKDLQFNSNALCMEHWINYGCKNKHIEQNNKKSFVEQTKKIIKPKNAIYYKNMILFY
jgi:hypothetical protein